MNRILRANHVHPVKLLIALGLNRKQMGVVAILRHQFLV